MAQGFVARGSIPYDAAAKTMAELRATATHQYVQMKRSNEILAANDAMTSSSRRR